VNNIIADQIIEKRERYGFHCHP